MPRYKAIFLDNDGILVDTEQYYYLATKDVLTTADVDLTGDLYRELFLIQGKGAWHLLQEKGVPPETIAGLRRKRNERYVWYVTNRDVLIPGVREVLQQLHGKVTVGVVTSSHREPFERTHKVTGLLPYFDFVLAEGDYARSKPEPDPYRKAMERCGVHCDECVVVEDSLRGLQAAKAAGIACWVIPRGLTSGSDFSAADRVLTRLEEILPLVL